MPRPDRCPFVCYAGRFDGLHSVTNVFPTTCLVCLDRTNRGGARAAGRDHVCAKSDPAVLQSACDGRMPVRLGSKPWAPAVLPRNAAGRDRPGQPRGASASRSLPERPARQLGQEIAPFVMRAIQRSYCRGEGSLRRPHQLSRSTSARWRRDRLHKRFDAFYPGQNILEQIDHNPTADTTGSWPTTLGPPVAERLHGDPEELTREILAQHRWKSRHGKTFV